MKVEFTGEFFVPGQSGERIEADHMERYKFACKFVQGRSILDIASGSGYSAPLVIKAGAISYEGADINKGLVEYSNATYGSDSINYYVGDICSFDRGKTYDMVTCFETIEHVKDYEAALRNLYNLLNQDGLLLISSPNRLITSPRCSSLEDKPHNDFHTQEFIPEELLSLLEKHGFVVGRNDVYGQRQRKVWSNRIFLKFFRSVFGNPDENASPVLSMIEDGKEPRYFVIVATKK